MVVSVLSHLCKLIENCSYPLEIRGEDAQRYALCIRKVSGVDLLCLAIALTRTDLDL